IIIVVLNINFIQRVLILKKYMIDRGKNVKMQLRFLLLYGLIFLVFITSGNQFLKFVYAQSNDVSDTTNIDRQVNDLLNKIGRGNIIDSTIDSLTQGMGSTPPPSSTQNPSPSPTQNPSSIPKSSTNINKEIMSIFENQKPSNSTVAIDQSTNQDKKYFAKIVDKNNNNENVISSNSLTDFNNNLLQFCLDSGIDYYSCSSIIQDSLQAAQFTNSYMGPAKVNTDLIGYTLELKIR
ncbi:MAG TPA: hypothetical protein VFK40_02835, partial [Nitrososphaeraceae archaeon]|nr:hypothetical protein [Nitrososphaeraceae archaeon]